MTNQIIHDITNKTENHFCCKNDLSLRIVMNALSLHWQTILTIQYNPLSRNDSKLTLKVELKNPLIRKMRLRAWGYSMNEYLYILGRSGLTLKYKTYLIVTQEYELEE